MVVVISILVTICFSLAWCQLFFHSLTPQKIALEFRSSKNNCKMGSSFSSSVEDARSGGGRFLYIENMKLKTKQLTEFLVSVEKEFPNLEVLSVGKSMIA